MLFNSINFIYFFVIVTTLYFTLPHRFRWFLLLMSSCYFYMSFVPVYILILGFTIIVDYFAGILIENSQGLKRKKFLIASLIANIGVLVFFKYYNFINDNLTFMLYGVGFTNPIPYLSIILPIGLSFHTFQAMSYTIEVYRGRHPAEKHFGIYALYVMFYPQLVAGPIERPQNMLHQFHEKHTFNIDHLTEGLKMMLWGFFKKVVIADRLALYVDPIYNNPQSYTGSTFILATIFFAFQIYCDFSGYSDIAIGSARVMGFNLMRNFNFPFRAKSVSEFWARWHISLSTWLRDYIYLPLILYFSRRMKKPKYSFWSKETYIYSIATIITFLISGIWHGAAWTFVILGALHGFYLVFAILTKNKRKKFNQLIGLDKLPKLYNAIQIIITFALVNIGFLFFRSKDVDTAWQILSAMFSDPFSKLYPGESQWITLISILLILLLIILEILQTKGYISSYFSKSGFSRPLRWAGYIALLLMICILGVGGDRFIYFQF